MASAARSRLPVMSEFTDCHAGRCGLLKLLGHRRSAYAPTLSSRTLATPCPSLGRVALSVVRVVSSVLTLRITDDLIVSQVVSGTAQVVSVRCGVQAQWRGCCPEFVSLPPGRLTSLTALTALTSIRGLPVAVRFSSVSCRPGRAGAAFRQSTPTPVASGRRGSAAPRVPAASWASPSAGGRRSAAREARWRCPQRTP
jgi:hypothetical protein